MLLLLHCAIFYEYLRSSNDRKRKYRLVSVMLVKSTDTVLKLSGSPKPGEAIRAVLLGRSFLDSNINATIEFHWYKKESNQEQKEHHQKQHKDSERREELHKDEFKIHGATAPIYLVRKVDIGCRIGALVIVRSNISSNDFVHGDEKEKKESKILATFKSEMSDIVYMESDHVDEDCYADDTPGEGRKIGKNWRLQQKSKTSSTTVAVAETPHKHPHSIGKSFFSSSKVGASPNTFEASAMSGINDEKMNAGKLVFKAERRQIDDDSTIVGAERSTKAENGAISSKKVREEKMLMDAGLSKHKYGSSGSYADDEDNKDESMVDYLLFVEKEEYETTKTKTITKSTERSNEFEDDKIYVDILHKLKAYARMRIRHMGHFLKILKFITFCVLYCTMLYLQTDPILSFEVTSTVGGLLKPRIRSTQDLYYLYEWLSESVVEPIWTEAPCGDGVCSAPYEFPAFGRFGCKADCGSATNIISFVIHIQTRFGNSIAVSALELMSQASWNLCLQDPGRYANDLPDLCWYEKDKKFSEVNSNELIRLDIISGNWYIHIKGDHLGLVAGKIYRLEENGDLVLSPSVPLWLTCTKVSLFTNVKARVSTRYSKKQNLTQVQNKFHTYNRSEVPRRASSMSRKGYSRTLFKGKDISKKTARIPERKNVADSVLILRRRLTTTTLEQDPEIFSYTGSIQTYKVPDGVTFLKVKCWGGAGGAGTGGTGGAGGYAGGDVSVTPGEILQIAVGEGGRSKGPPQSVNGAGGGLSGIFSTWDSSSRDNTHAAAILVAGGGGGGGWGSFSGGCGGGETGGSIYTSHRPGTQIEGGVWPGTNNGKTVSGTSGTKLSGGRGGGGAQTSGHSGWPQEVWGITYGVAGGGDGQNAAGGGGGYYGASGGTDLNGNGGSAAGGSGYVGGDSTHAVTNGENLNTFSKFSATNPPKVDDEDYQTGIGVALCF